MHKIEVRNRAEAEGKLSTGRNTQVFLDGKQLGTVSRLKYDIDAKGVGKVILELYAQVDIKANAKLKIKRKKVK